MSVEFDSPANRIISQFAPKNKFRIDTSLPDISFLRQLSVQGRMRYDQKDLSGADLVLTPTTGSTIFIYRILTINSSASAGTLSVTNAGNTRISLPFSSNNPIQIDYIDSLVGDGTATITFSQSAGIINITVFSWVENTSRIRDVTT